MKNRKPVSPAEIDYSEAEKRLLAHLSSPAPVPFEDIHTAKARELFGDTSPTGRRRAKALNYFKMYGGKG
jgi:DNA polymerase I-like protein with 3'-5' exonuclease and polymerase domains